MPKKTGMIVLGHGSRRQEVESAFKSMVQRVGDMLAHGPVLPAFFSLGEPTLSEQIKVLADLGYTRIVIMQYFLCNGIHIEQDIPAEIAIWRQAYPDIEFFVLPTLEGDPVLEKLVADRFRTA